VATGELSERKAAILRALVQSYIRTGEAVGSEMIVSSTGLGVSSATIRNELAALEEMGYLTQPHTSAGRVPTDLGYRCFVDMLPSRTRLGDPERRAIVHFFGEALSDVDEILRGTTQLLAHLTRYASLALVPTFLDSPIARCELVGIGSSTLLLVVFDSGRVDKRVLDVPSHADQADADAVSSELLAATKGATLEAASRDALERAKVASEPRRALLDGVAEALGSMAESREAEHVFFRGAAHIAAEEGFEGRDTLRGIFEALERETEVLQLLREASATPAVRVTIGAESEVTGMWHASMVAAPYGPGEHPMGTIGVVGPTRMDYVSAISAVRAVAERLSAAVQALSG
jgi:heat-inducible transcriptional repressor